MDGLNLGVEMLGSLAMGSLGAVGAWFKLKSKQDILSVELTNEKAEREKDSETFSSEIEKLRNDKRTLNEQIHRRIDNVKEVVEKNREKSDTNVQEIKSEMNKMELRIIQAIHEIKK